jgi:hypothetical protein|tara:strand:+ start:12364 stop:13170 length:807 start_codon:yes stop_codon:yes gene_type:complete
MITGIQFKTGFATQLDNIGDRIFKFNDGFNVLFGTNGVGKSVILHTLKSYCGIPNDTGGWSRVSDPAVLGTSVPEHFPFSYRAYSPGNCDAWVGWDGVPSFFNDGDIKVDSTFFFDKERQTADGITTEAEQMEALATKPSSGQYRIQRINKVMELIKTPPDISVIPEHIANKQHAQAEVTYFESKERNGKPTLLFDEPERALALPKQKELFGILAELSKNYQVIIATHSPFVFGVKSANIIDVVDGYALTCKTIVKETAKAIRLPRKK